MHYLALLEQKIGALDQAAPLVGGQLPAEFATLRRLLEARMGKPGKREFVQVLRLLEVFRPDDVLAGVSAALERGVIGCVARSSVIAVALFGCARRLSGGPLTNSCLTRPAALRRLRQRKGGDHAFQLRLY